MFVIFYYIQFFVSINSRTRMVLQCWHTVGVWRSWLARTHGVREVVGSSPATPTSDLYPEKWTH